MAIELVFKNKHCEWLDIEGATEEDLIYLFHIKPILE
jgi:hypothetical protein